MEDELFAAKYDNHDKNIDDCVTYILNWVQKSGCNGFCDDEIYGQAIHYYEEKDIEVGKPLNCQVSVNHHIELTEEEKAQARQEAIRQYQQEQMNKMRNRDTAKRTSQRTETEVHQPSLFAPSRFRNSNYLKVSKPRRQYALGPRKSGWGTRPCRRSRPCSWRTPAWYPRAPRARAPHPSSPRCSPGPTAKPRRCPTRGPTPQLAPRSSSFAG